MIKNLPLLLITFLFACSSESSMPVETNSPAAEIPPVSSGPLESHAVVQKALSVLKAEPKIKDVLYQPEAVVHWQVGVLDDGTRRNGYAEYLCLTLKDVGIGPKGTIVRVVDVSKIAAGGVPGSVTSLGSMNCETGQPFDA